jgi:hypothetical protein
VTAGEGLVGFAERRLELRAGASLRYLVAGAEPALLLVHGLDRIWKFDELPVESEVLG